MSRIKINDGLNNQQRYQKRLKEKGLCTRCAKNKTEQSICEECISRTSNRKHYNKNKNLQKRKEEIIENINSIMENNKKDDPKMNKIYIEVILKLHLKCSVATIRKYWLERNNDEN